MHFPPRHKKSHVAAGLGMAALIFGSSAMLVAAEPSKNFDFKKINQNLALATHQAIAGNKMVKRLIIQLDPRGTNLDADQIERAQISLQLTGAPWTANAVQVNRIIDVKVSRQSGAETGFLEVGSVGRVTTEPLAFLKYLAKAKGAKCSASHEVTGVARIERKHECAMAKDLLAANDLNAAAEAIRHHVTEASQELSGFATAAKAEMANTKNLVLNQESRKLLAKVNSKIAQLNGIKITDEGEGFVISSELMELGQNTEVRNVKFTVSGTSVTMAGNFKAPFDLNVYAASKPELVHLFTGLEQGKEFAVEHVRAKSRVLTRLLDEFTTGRWTPAPLTATSPDDPRLGAFFLSAIFASGVT